MQYHKYDKERLLLGEKNRCLFWGQLRKYN